MCIINARFSYTHTLAHVLSSVGFCFNRGSGAIIINKYVLGNVVCIVFEKYFKKQVKSFYFIRVI